MTHANAIDRSCYCPCNLGAALVGSIAGSLSPNERHRLPGTTVIRSGFAWVVGEDFSAVPDSESQ